MRGKVLESAPEFSLLDLCFYDLPGAVDSGYHQQRMENLCITSHTLQEKLWMRDDYLSLKGTYSGVPSFHKKSTDEPGVFRLFDISNPSGTDSDTATCKPPVNDCLGRYNKAQEERKLFEQKSDMSERKSQMYTRGLRVGECAVLLLGCCKFAANGFTDRPYVHVTSGKGLRKQRQA